MQLWAELADGSCRWRQTGSEVKVCVLCVPRDLKPSQLAVTLDPYYIKGLSAVALVGGGSRECRL